MRCTSKGAASFLVPYVSVYKALRNGMSENQHQLYAFLFDKQNIRILVLIEIYNSYNRSIAATSLTEFISTSSLPQTANFYIQ